MSKFWNWLFYNNKKVNVEDDNVFELSMMIDRENITHLKSMNLFIDELKKKQIQYKTFLSEVSLPTSINPDRYHPFNIAVDIKFKDDLMQIHNQIYGI